MTLAAERERSKFSAQEQAELERSLLEAQNLAEPILLKPAAIARYANPPGNTAFPLEYCFHLLGEIAGLTVLDYGCGSGTNSVHLALRGARVIGVDLSPDLIAIARNRTKAHNVDAQFVVRSAYSTGLPDASVDIVFAIAIFHHLDLAKANQELRRVLKPNGIVIVQEPVRDSKFIAALRRLFPARAEISPFEYPLTRAQLDELGADFQCESIRRFRLPFVALSEKAASPLTRSAYALDAWLLRSFAFLAHFATMEVRKLRYTVPY